VKLSILIPVLNEEAQLASLLPLLQPARKAGHQVLICDGGSDDASLARAEPWVDKVISAGRGRARQMNEAAHHATGDVLVFLHADTRPPERFAEIILDAVGSSTDAWGRFDVRMDSERRVLRLVAGMMNLRSRWTGIATGDQALFVTRRLFARIDGFPKIPLMEDIAISKRLKEHSRPLCLRATVTTSARRWERDGAYTTIVNMWWLRLAYWMGADPADLAARYYDRQG
jgi:rSAM/selenodomain-associated transferase 2